MSNMMQQIGAIPAPEELSVTPRWYRSPVDHVAACKEVGVLFANALGSSAKN